MVTVGFIYSQGRLNIVRGLKQVLLFRGIKNIFNPTKKYMKNQ
jgi:hypothetical protein